ncbi:hypothetical protein CH333_01445, partial [candidate division WOR-3 bacterium JGI_Cruoil_03_44_89]
NLDGVPVSDVKNPASILFSESNSRFIVEVDGERKDKFEEIMSGSTFGEIGEVVPSGNLVIENLFSLSIARLETAWRSRRL